MRFKVDENLPLEVAAVLSEGGHDATTVQGEDLAGRGDPDIASVCQREGRALVTLDLDFGDIRTYPPNEYSGLIELRLRQQDRPRILEIFPRIMRLLSVEPLRLWVVDEHHVRIRE